MEDQTHEIHELENKLAYVLAKVYMKIPWTKIKVNNAHKFFIERMRASNNTRTFKEYLDVVCRKCNVEMVKIDTEIIEYLDDNSSKVMHLLRNETLYMCNFALEEVDIIKNAEATKVEE